MVGVCGGRSASGVDGRSSVGVATASIRRAKESGVESRVNGDARASWPPVWIVCCCLDSWTLVVIDLGSLCGVMHGGTDSHVDVLATPIFSTDVANADESGRSASEDAWLVSRVAAAAADGDGEEDTGGFVAGCGVDVLLDQMLRPTV